jgi:phosphatidylinositol glycan class V
MKQLPNFLLAFPVDLLSACAIYSYFSYDWKRTLSLGLFSRSVGGNSRTLLGTYHSIFIASDNLFVFVAHWFALTLFCCFFMHVQVATRFLASQCAPMYWFCAHLLLNPTATPTDSAPSLQTKNKPGGLVFVFQGSRESRVAKLVKSYFFGYFILGIALYSNFYPWT